MLCSPVPGNATSPSTLVWPTWNAAKVIGCFSPSAKVAGDTWKFTVCPSVQVWPAHARKSEFGYLLGQVRGASKYPITQSEMQRRLQNEDLARHLGARDIDLAAQSVSR